MKWTINSHIYQIALNEVPIRNYAAQPIHGKHSTLSITSFYSFVISSIFIPLQFWMKLRVFRSAVQRNTTTATKTALTPKGKTKNKVCDDE